MIALLINPVIHAAIVDFVVRQFSARCVSFNPSIASDKLSL